VGGQVQLSARLKFYPGAAQMTLKRKENYFDIKVE
jgi:hypothetical protein